MTMMNINDVGATAFVIACFRAREEDRANPLFRDPCAKWFSSDAITEQVGTMEKIIPEIVEIIRYRTCYFNNVVTREIGNGVEQIVNVGAGFDMRPEIFRAEGVTFYDVDQPAVLAYKRGVLEQRGVATWPAVPCNYMDVNLPEKLAEAGLDHGKRTLFIWEGNTMYLPCDVIGDFLTQLREGVTSFGIAFDYLSEKVINRTTGIESLTQLADFFEHTMKAPWIYGIDDLDEFARRHGLHTVESGDMGNADHLRVPEETDKMARFAGLYSYALLSNA